MDLVKNLLVLLHLLGMAAIVGGWLVVIREPRILPSIVWGARAQILTGLLLVLAVVACAEIANARQKRGEGNPTLVHAAGALAVLNAAIAALW